MNADVIGHDDGRRSLGLIRRTSFSIVYSAFMVEARSISVIKERNILVVGASGGIGAAIARTFAKQGARIICAARDQAKVAKLVDSLGACHAALQLDVLCDDSLSKARLELNKLAPEGIDFVINAVGGDIRKSFMSHTNADITQMVEVNFIAATNLLKLCLPHMKQGDTNAKRQFVQVSGFVNARVAFPYYSVDVAMRSATRTLFESVQRELTLEGHKNIQLKLFCPTATDTAAERPFLSLWQNMGIQPAHPGEVALALLTFLSGKRHVGAMGGFGNALLALADFISPKLANYLWLGKAGREMNHIFNQPTSLK